MKRGPIKHSVRKCQRCYDDTAVRLPASVFALCHYCLSEVFVEARINDHSLRDANGVHSGYMALVDKYGWEER